MASTVLSRLAGIRDTYRFRRALLRDLSSLTGPDDLKDFEAAITRSEAEGNPDAAEVRRIMAARHLSLHG
jgi:hypothetical protein